MVDRLQHIFIVTLAGFSAKIKDKTKGRGVGRMELKRLWVERERQPGEGVPGVFFLGDAAELMPRLLEKYRGSVQCIYLDPPFTTGKRFVLRTRVGEKEWRSGNGSLMQTAYQDNMPRDAYMAMMEQVLRGCRALLSDTGLIFMHIDYRLHGHMRLLMDRIFGEERLLNEIVWAYQTGGRARRYFGRKHDIILLYSKGPRYYFDLKSTGEVRPGGRSNHMKKHVDPDGRVYRSIRSGGKIYTYYDDEPVYPGDVWDDVSHLQQKDPQRTGYDTQKPMRLLERVIHCSTRPGDLVMDLFAGSGTSLATALQLGRPFVGADNSPLSLYTVRRRLADAPVEYMAQPSQGEPQVEVRGWVGIGYYEVEMAGYQVESGVSARSFVGLDALDSWALGYMRGGAFCPMAAEYRSRTAPALGLRLRLPVLTGAPVLRVGDVLGRFFYYELDEGGMGI